LADRLRDLSLTVEERPLLRFAPPSDWTELDNAIDALRDGYYPTIVFTSPRAAESFRARWLTRGLDWPSARSRDVAVWGVGPGTAKALDAVLGVARLPNADSVGRVGAAAALAEALARSRVAGRVLFPCGDHRRNELPSRLRAAGITVDEVVCYHSVLAEVEDARAAASGAAVLVVVSPLVVGLLAGACPSAPRPALVAIGPTTRDACAAAGWPAEAVAAHPTVDAVNAAVRSLLL
jgi:uroporphyrinogen-III synthase